MALDSSRLTDAIDAKMALYVTGYSTNANRSNVKAGMLKAIAEAVIEEITGNATVSATDTHGDTITNAPVT
jgi:hypothetical protein